MTKKKNHVENVIKRICRKLYPDEYKWKDMIWHQPLNDTAGVAWLEVYLLQPEEEQLLLLKVECRRRFKY